MLNRCSIIITLVLIIFLFTLAGCQSNFASEIQAAFASPTLPPTETPIPTATLPSGEPTERVIPTYASPATPTARSVTVRA